MLHIIGSLFLLFFLFIATVTLAGGLLAWWEYVFNRSGVKVFKAWCKKTRAKMAAEFDELGGTGWVEKYAPRFLDPHPDWFLGYKTDDRLITFSGAIRVETAIELLGGTNEFGTLLHLMIRFTAPMRVGEWWSYLEIDACLVIVSDDHGTYALFVRCEHKKFKRKLMKGSPNDPVKEAVASTYGVKPDQYNPIGRT